MGKERVEWYYIRDSSVDLLWGNRISRSRLGQDMSIVFLNVPQKANLGRIEWIQKEELQIIWRFLPQIPFSDRWCLILLQKYDSLFFLQNPFALPAWHRNPMNKPNTLVDSETALNYKVNDFVQATWWGRYWIHGKAKREGEGQVSQNKYTPRQ